MALSKIQAESVNLADDFAFTGTVTGAGDVIDASTTVPSEGGSATTNLVQGLAKCWVDLNGTGTIVIRDSLNVASIADDGSGMYFVNTSNIMGNDDYAITSGAEISGNFTAIKSRLYSASQMKLETHNAAGSWMDAVAVYGVIHGDLA